MRPLELLARRRYEDEERFAAEKRVLRMARQGQEVPCEMLEVPPQRTERCGGNQFRTYRLLARSSRHLSIFCLPMMDPTGWVYGAWCAGWGGWAGLRARAAACACSRPRACCSPSPAACLAYCTRARRLALTQLTDFTCELAAAWARPRRVCLLAPAVPACPGGGCPHAAHAATHHPPALQTPPSLWRCRWPSSQRGGPAS